MNQFFPAHCTWTDDGACARYFFSKSTPPAQKLNSWPLMIFSCWPIGDAFRGSCGVGRGALGAHSGNAGNKFRITVGTREKSKVLKETEQQGPTPLPPGVPH